MSFEGFLNKVATLVSKSGCPVFSVGFDADNKRYVAYFADGLTVFANPISPSIMIQTENGRLFRATI